MTADYVKLREENKLRYGWDVGRYDGELLTDRYAKRTHFIFELLQNAEDALRRRAGWTGSRPVTFNLSDQDAESPNRGDVLQSGDEAFAIESYVLPMAVPERRREPGQTTIILPLREDDRRAHKEITQGLENLGTRPLLFLRHVKEISWTVQGGPSGLYFRDEPQVLDENVRGLTLMGEHVGEDTEERWLVLAGGLQ
jgi:hypothetical protein